MTTNSLTIANNLMNKASLRQMLVLVKLAELGSMTRAAAALRMSQPAVSVMVADLERLLGAPLFLRHARGVNPTRVTRELLPVAKRIVAAANEGAEAVSAIVNGHDGVVRISANATAKGKLLMPFLPAFSAKFPRIQVWLTDVGTTAPLDIITSGQCDLLCTGEPAIIPEDCSFVRCCGDRLVVVGRSDNACVQRGAASMADLAAEHWLLAPSGTVSRSRFEEVSEIMDLPPENRCSIICNMPSVTLELILRRNLLALLPESIALPWIATGLVSVIESDASIPLPPLGVVLQNEGTVVSARTLVKELTEFGAEADRTSVS